MLYITNDKEYFEKSKLPIIHLEVESRKLFLVVIECINKHDSIVDASNCFYNKTGIQIDFKTIHLLKHTFENNNEDLFFERIKYQLVDKLNRERSDSIIYLHDLKGLPNSVTIVEKKHHRLFKWK